MGTTPRYAWRFPAGQDTPNVPLDIQEALTDVEATVGVLDDTLATKVAGRVGKATVSANSATWNSATKVVTNLTCTLPGIAGASYRVTAKFSWLCAAVSNTVAFGVGWRLGGAGSVVNTDPVVGPTFQRSHPDGTGINESVVITEFTAAGTGTHCVAVVGWMPTGNTGVTNLFAHNNSSTDIVVNEIFVDRVA